MGQEVRSSPKSTAVLGSPLELTAGEKIPLGLWQRPIPAVGSQWCFDSIYFRPLGAITQPLISWQNRPTYQQAVSVERSVGR